MERIKHHARRATDHVIAYKHHYLLSTLIVALGFAAYFSFLGKPQASAAVTTLTLEQGYDDEDENWDFLEGAEEVAGPIFMTLVSDSSDTLVNVKFQINDVADTVAGDFDSVLLVEDTNGDGYFEVLDPDNIVGAGSVSAIGSEILAHAGTLDPETFDFTPGTWTIPSSASGPNLALFLLASEDPGFDHEFTVTIPSGTDVFTLGSGTVNSPGFTSAAVTIEQGFPLDPGEYTQVVTGSMGATTNYASDENINVFTYSHPGGAKTYVVEESPDDSDVTLFIAPDDGGSPDWDNLLEEEDECQEIDTSAQTIHIGYVSDTTGDYQISVGDDGCEGGGEGGGGGDSGVMDVSLNGTSSNSQVSFEIEIAGDIDDTRAIGISFDNPNNGGGIQPVNGAFSITTNELDGNGTMSYSWATSSEWFLIENDGGFNASSGTITFAFPSGMDNQNDNQIRVNAMGISDPSNPGASGFGSTQNATGAFQGNGVHTMDVQIFRPSGGSPNIDLRFHPSIAVNGDSNIMYLKFNNDQFGNSATMGVSNVTLNAALNVPGTYTATTSNDGLAIIQRTDGNFPEGDADAAWVLTFDFWEVPEDDTSITVYAGLTDDAADPEGGNVVGSANQSVGFNCTGDCEAVVDEDAPVFQSSNPPDGGVADFFAFIEGISMTFDEVTIGSNNLKLTRTDNLAGDNLCADFGGDGETISCIANADALETNTSYTLVAPADTLGDSFGNQISSEISITFTTPAFDPNDEQTPPIVEGGYPWYGDDDVPLNSPLAFQFSQEMNTTTAGSVLSSDNIALYVADDGGSTGGNICASGGCTFAATGDPTLLMVTPSSNLTADTEYLVVLSSNITNADEIQLYGGAEEAIFFETGDSTDTEAPTWEMDPEDDESDVDRLLPEIVIQFDKPMNPATFDHTDAASIEFFEDADDSGTLNGDEEDLLGNAQYSYSYSAPDQTLRISNSGLMIRNAKYVFGIGTAVEDIFGNSIASDGTSSFRTVDEGYTAHTPEVVYADADNYGIWVQFNGPMHNDESQTADNYAVSCGGSSVALDNATLVYHPVDFAVSIDDVGLSTGDSCTVTVTGIRDVTGGNTIVANGSTNVASLFVLDAAETGGFLGSNVAGFESTVDWGEFWENPTFCWTRNSIAGQSTGIECEFPAPAALTTGAEIILTMPTGFDVSSVSAPAATASWLNGDINGFGPGVTTISNVAVNESSRTITLTIAHSGDAMGSNDHLFFELDGLMNAATAGSKEVSAIVMNSSGVKQGQTINFAPFEVVEGGNRTISGTVCKAADDGGDCSSGSTGGIEGVKVFAHSISSSGEDGFLGGQFEATTDSSGDYSFTSLPAGIYEVQIFMDYSAISDIAGGFDFQEADVEDGDATDVDFKFLDLASSGEGATLTVDIEGAPASEKMDVLCFQDNSFSAPIMKTATADGSGDASVDLTLIANMPYFCEVFPHIPIETIQSGGFVVPDFNFMPPEPFFIEISSDETYEIEIQSADHQIIGKVVDGDGTGIANAFVDAWPIGGKVVDDNGEHVEATGSFTMTQSDGSFVLNITEGTFEISSCSQSCSNFIEATVEDNENGGDGNSASDVYSGGDLVTGTGLTLTINRGDLTIAGTAQDENSNGIQYAWIDAMQVSSGDTCSSFTPVGGFSGSPTDANGNYTIYVESNATYRIEAFSPAYGPMACKIVSVTDSSVTSQTLKADASGFGTLSGTVTKGGENVQGANVFCFGNAGENFAISGVDGTWSMKVPAGTYACDGFIHGAGELTPLSGITVAGEGENTGNNFSVAAPGTIAVTMTGITDAFCHAFDSNGRGSGTDQNTNGVYSWSALPGTYTVECGGPAIPPIVQQNVAVTAGSTTGVTFTGPERFTQTGRVVDTSGANVTGAGMSFVNSDGIAVFVTSDAAAGENANVSVDLPAGNYDVRAFKDGFIDEAEAQTITVTEAGTFSTRTLTQSGASIAVTVQASGSNYTGSARVIATRADGVTVVAESDPSVSSGSNATVNASNGVWTVKAVGDNGKESTESTVIITNNTAGTSPTLALSQSITGFVQQEAQNTSFTPGNGGTFGNATIGDEFKVTIQPGAMSGDDTGSIETKFDPTLAVSTPGKTFVGKSAISITPKNDAGKPIKDGTATIKIPYSDADVTAAGVEESNLLCSVWNETAGDWETLGTAVDEVNNILTCQATHFSTFGVVGGSGGGGGDDDSSPSPSIVSPVTGGSYAGVSPPTIPDLVEPTASETVSHNFPVGGAIPFSVGASEHTGTLLLANETEIAITIESDPVTITLARGETEIIDTNSDEVLDLSVTYDDFNADAETHAVSFTNLTDEGELGYAIAIQAGTYEVDSRDVKLFFNVENADTMLIGNSEEFEDVDVFVPYSETAEWTLTEGNGEKTVYVQFRSAEGGTVTVSDTIMLTGQPFDQVEEVVEEEMAEEEVTSVVGCDLVPGNVYKTIESPAVYYVTDSCTKRPFTSGSVFFTYFDSYDEIEIVGEEALAGVPDDTIEFMPLGPLYQPIGTTLVKAVTDAKVFTLVSGQRHWIATETVFAALGYAWSWVEDVAVDFLDLYEEGDALESEFPRPTGTLIQYEGSSDVYLLQEFFSGSELRVKRLITDTALIPKYGNEDRIIVIPVDEVYDEGEPIES